ncbi:MAG: ribonuclease HIII [Planctomycetota bacterium]|jgi:ribonuclease HIII
MTTTLELPTGRIRELKEALVAEGFDIRPLEHAYWQARGEEVVVNAYRSGKVVVQGKGELEFLAAHGFGTAPAPALDIPVAGSDESGKGDYFGPLVVAAVVAEPGQVHELQRAGVKDGKKLSDGAIKRAAFAVRNVCPCAVRILSPVEYNARHAEEGNVALFLSTLHAEAIAEAVAAADRCELVVIDQFTFSERLEGALEMQGVDLPVEIRPRAEDNPAVAAASVLARAEFLAGLAELGYEQGLELPKGASAKVEKVAREIYQAGGIEALREVAKVHFKTTKRVTEGLF